MSTAFTIALGTSTLDGPFPFGEIVGGAITGGATIDAARTWVFKLK